MNPAEITNTLQDLFGEGVETQTPTSWQVETEDLRTVRFALAVRGYRMSEVDALLARLATELEDARAEAGPDAGDDASGDAPNV